MLSTFTPTIYKHWVIISVNIGFIPMGCILRQACCECDYFISTFNDNFQCMGNDSCCIFIHLTGDRKNRHWTSDLFLHNKFCFTINDQNQIPYVVCLPRLTWYTLPSIDSFLNKNDHNLREWEANFFILCLLIGTNGFLGIMLVENEVIVMRCVDIFIFI